MRTDLLYSIGFSHFLGIGPMRFRSLIADRSIEEAYHLSAAELTELIGSRLTDRFIAFRQSFRPEQKLAEYRDRNISVVPFNSEHFPKQLSALSDAPICLYVRGNVEALTRPEACYVGIVGTRRSTGGGVRITQQIVTDLVKRCRETVIVSGLAYGIDAVAHRAAIEQGVPTVAFLGCGVDIPHPSGNRSLYDEIIARGGVGVSEFPPGQMVAPGLFISRNRLISGLSRGVVIVEGSKKSGSLITARYAAEQGKDVFAVPGSPLIEQSEAPNRLITEGAICVAQITDIGDTFGYGIARDEVHSIGYEMTGEELRLFRYLETAPRRVDEIVQQFQSTAVAVMNLLSQLELEGCVERGLDDRYGARAGKRV